MDFSGSRFYETAQFIAILPKSSSKLDSSVDPAIESYSGLEDQEQDYSARIQFLKDSLEVAKSHASTDATVLKVVVTPEFFFRPKSGVYSAESTKIIYELLKQIIDKPEYMHWIFFFGSIVGDAKHLGFPEKLKSLESKTIAHNVVPIFGGNGGRSLVSIKKATSELDFVAATRDFTTYGTATKAADHKGMVLLEDVKMTPVNAVASDVLFQACGFSFGVEVCVDHWDARLREHLKLTKEGRPQFHIVTGCGILIHTYKMCALPEGFVFYVDGGNTFSALHHIKGNYSINDQPRSSDPAKVGVTKHAVPSGVAWKTLFIEDFPPEVHIYEPVKAPQPEEGWAK